MAEEKVDDNIDKDYIDTSFVNVINNIDNDSLKNICNLALSTYKTTYSYEDLEKLNQECKNIIENESNIEHFIRQLKYLFNKGIYGRINKNYSKALIELGLSEEKILILYETQKKYFEENLLKNEEDEKNTILTLKDFDMITEMPVGDTQYKTMVDGENNYDFKKQKLFINLRLNKDGEDHRKIIQVDKNKLIGLYSKMEQLQEQLDKLS